MESFKKKQMNFYITYLMTKEHYQGVKF